MVMSSFLQRIIPNDDDHNRPNVPTADYSPKRGGVKSPFGMSGWLKKRANSSANVPGDARTPPRASPRELYGCSRPLFSKMDNHQELDHVDLEPPATLEDVVRDFEEHYKSPSRSPPSPKSNNFVKKLVAALEKKQLRFNVEYKAGEVATRRNDSLHYFAHEHSAPVQEAISDPVQTYVKFNYESLESIDPQKREVEEETVESNEYEAKETKPRITVGLSKKVLDAEDPSVYWISAAEKKSRRKKSFKNFLSMFTRRKGGKNSEPKGKQTLFASVGKPNDVAYIFGYDKISASSRATSLQSITDELLHHENSYVERVHRNSGFSTFLVASTPVVETNGLTSEADERDETTKNPFCSKRPISVTQLREDSGYDSNFSALEEESTDQESTVSSRVKQIAQQLSKLPNHPLARSEPRLYKPADNASPQFGEIVELRRNVDEPIYDVPNPRPKSSNHDETYALKRRNIMLPTTAPNKIGFSVFASDEEPHYATVRPRHLRTHFSYENLYPVISETSYEDLDEGVRELKMTASRSSFGSRKGDMSFAFKFYEQNNYMSRNIM